MLKSEPGIQDRATRGILALGWIVLVAAALTLTVAVGRGRLLAELSDAATVLHRQLSQRVDQHDAHLTALSAVAISEGTGESDVFQQVAATIVHFYPRITAVDLVALTDRDRSLSTRPQLSADHVDIVRGAALASDGLPALLPAPDAPGSYLIVKRSPNSDLARYGIALEISSAALLDTEQAFWTQPSVHLSLLLPDGTRLIGGKGADKPQFEKELGSQSQPLRLQAGIAPALTDILPPGLAAAVMALTTLVYFGLGLGFQQYARARRAEQQADFSAQEARLAHASRVNALGEMASGMAHELTQPLTAILSQAQAGRHLARRGDVSALEQVMQQIADQAKRASAILESLRNWTKASQPSDRLADVTQAVRSVELLLSREARTRNVELTVKTGSGPMTVRGDQVEVEQIVFNLVHNAIDAASGRAEAGVNVAVHSVPDRIVIDVSDTGPGVPNDMRNHLFEPFVTSKPAGTGLGLALCQRLAERMGGEVTLLDSLPTTFRVILPRQSLQDGGTTR